MVQKRKTATKSRIKTAFTELLKEKGIEGLTVMDIARKAGINRGTFYAHYVDKYELMEKLEMEIIYDLKQILIRSEEGDPNDPVELIPYSLILESLVYVKHDFAFISAIAGKGGDPQFITMVKEILSELITIKIAQSPELEFKKGNLPEDYAQEILLSSIVGIILLWIKKGAKETPEEIAQMITKAKQLSPYELLI
ncbi:TetR/AcrR family transcriptional regulator (plasmid) [Enterococcus gilvus]|jgi:AcrR family transcriptional regulator|uniref:TetR/AcrR family transcriptional regulator n=1 Tax=Enterococcus gilvus TaxID=160453 RepID=UPI000DF5EF3C|nr:TetR/AcrR family transcriptional regulator [Enterococcus gilvus]AXG40419.1 TetR/AcrR family transcriptional regulator [Enterococcus gilvus]